MDKRNQLLGRVREDAENLIQLTRGLNFPVGRYLNETDLNALCDALSLELGQWTAGDLERIPLLRDGLYELMAAIGIKGRASQLHSSRGKSASFMRSRLNRGEPCSQPFGNF
ncbi:hypothetical protein [Bradyrhizobium sp. B120]|uniref:hypothetical protein n=1 Tax=Bradyrhizobium sp. B120 TaxID=3410088 RepID=UPI003B986EF3